MTIAQLFKPTRRVVIDHPISGPAKEAPARHRLTHDTADEHRASRLLDGVSPRTRRARP